MTDNKRLRLTRDDDVDTTIDNDDSLYFPTPPERHARYNPIDEPPSKDFIESVEQTIENAQRNLDALRQEIEAAQEKEAYRFPEPDDSDDTPTSAA